MRTPLKHLLIVHGLLFAFFLAMLIWQFFHGWPDRNGQLLVICLPWLIASLVSAVTLIWLLALKHARACETDAASTLFDREIDTAQHDKEAVEKKAQNSANAVATYELALAKNLALNNAREQTQKLADTGHELLTPLNSIAGFTELLLQQPQKNAQAHHFLHRIFENAQHLTALIRSFMDNTASDSWQVQLHYQPVDLYQLLFSVSATLAHEAHSKGIELLTDIDAVEGLVIQADIMRLRQIMINLIANAVRNTDSGHVIIAANNSEPLSTENDALQLMISVTDTGRGIDEDAKETLFSRHVQKNTAVSSPPQTAIGAEKNPSGFGLGLPIVASIVDAMGAAIDICCNTPQGTAFILTLPATLSNLQTTQYTNRHANYALLCPYRPALNNLIKQLTVLGIQASELSVCDSSNELQALARKTAERGENLSAIVDCSKLTDHEIASLCDQIEIDVSLSVIFLCGTQCGANSKNLIDCQTKLKTKVSDNHDTPRCIFLTKPFTQRELHEALDNNPALRKNKEAITPATEGPNVLVVDDSFANLELMLHFLSIVGCHTTTTSSGEHALSLCKTGQFDCIVLDIMMTPMSGVQTLQALRAQERYRGTPIIACTANVTAAEHQLLLQAGFNAVCYKPMSINNLKTLLIAQLGNLTQWSNWLATIEQELSPAANDATQATRVNIANNVSSLDTCPLNIAIALDKAGGDGQLAKKIFVALVEESRLAIPVLSRWQTIQPAEKLDVMHTLHGGACMTGTEHLRQLTGSAEQRLKQGKTLHDIDLSAIKEALHAVDVWANSVDVDILFEG